MPPARAPHIKHTMELWTMDNQQLTNKRATYWITPNACEYGIRNTGILRCKWWWGVVSGLWPQFCVANVSLCLSLSLFLCLHFRRNSMERLATKQAGKLKSVKMEFGMEEGDREWAWDRQRKMHVITNNKPVKWNRLAIMYDTLSVFQLIQNGNLIWYMFWSWNANVFEVRNHFRP